MFLNFYIIFMVGFGGFIGAVLRFVAYEAFTRLSKLLSLSPQLTSLLPTLFVNVLGSFVLGLLFAYMQKSGLNPSKSPLVYFLSTGVLGAFTTFSAFSYANFLLLQNGLYIQLLLNIVLNVGLCIVAVYAGFVVLKF